MSSASSLPPPAILLNGSTAPAETPVVLHAGPWRLQFVEGELRYLSLGGKEAVRRIYAAVRDGSWNTIAPRRTPPVIETGGGGFTIRYTSEHVDGDIDFQWESRVTGTAEGVVSWEFDGVARRDFFKNRIGFCILHPLETCVNQPVEVEHVSGDTAERKFPGLIAPDQPVRGLHDYRRMTYQVTPELAVELKFEGDTFEMEDQRNWTDASFKTYSTPQRIPMPARMKEGQRVRQVITLTALGDFSRSVQEETAESPAVEFTGRRLPLPAIGLGMPSHGNVMDDREAVRLSALKLSHLRTEVRPVHENWQDLLTGAALEAARVNAGLEIALHLTAEVSAETLEILAGLPGTLGAPVVRWLVLEEGKAVANPALLARVRKVLELNGAPAGAGTDMDFFQFNNNRPAPDSADFTFSSMRPQAHNFDDAAVIENLAGQEAVTESALAVCAPLPFVASPVTFKRRWHKGPPRPETELPPMVDRRQLSLLGAGWLTGSLRALAQAGAVSGTWFETTGWRGVMELADGPPLPQEFPSVPGAVFPMYHVLRAVADFRGEGEEKGEIAELSLTHPLSVQALALSLDGKTRLIIANVTPNSLTVKLPVSEGTLRLLDPAAAAETAQEPETFWDAEPAAWAGPALELPPYAVVFIDNKI